MQLTVFNGSPRGLKSNTRILLSHFQRGFEETPGNSMVIHDLVRVNDQEAFRQAYAQAETVFLAFPLYVDAMPGIVKTFIEETLQPFAARESNPPMLFLVQSGFPEGIHSTFVARYLKKLAARMNAPCLGVVIKGGVEGIQSQPEKAIAKLLDSFYQLGLGFGQTGKLDEALVGQLAQPIRFPKAVQTGLLILSKFGLVDSGWNIQLKRNGAFERRFAQPDCENEAQ
ncbi:MAG: NAD(P)H-dependent oxidoreductase [Anaerolineaceae bacterium]|nr:NAD(P)H-dependent oxidoreductase [Anaerolineaceae bacterium]